MKILSNNSVWNNLQSLSIYCSPIEDYIKHILSFENILNLNKVM